MRMPTQGVSIFRGEEKKDLKIGVLKIETRVGGKTRPPYSYYYIRDSALCVFRDLFRSLGTSSCHGFRIGVC